MNNFPSSDWRSQSLDSARFFHERLKSLQLDFIGWLRALHLTVFRWKFSSKVIFSGEKKTTKESEGAENFSETNHHRRRPGDGKLFHSTGRPELSTQVSGNDKIHDCTLLAVSHLLEIVFREADRKSSLGWCLRLPQHKDLDANFFPQQKKILDKKTKTNSTM